MDELIRDLFRRADERSIELEPLAKEAGVHFTTLWRWREGRGRPTLKSFMRVQEALERMSAST